MNRRQSELTISEEFVSKIQKENQKARVMKLAPTIVLAVLVAGFSILCGGDFASLRNLISILNQLAIPLLVALGLTFVIMIGSIDLSINGTVGMSGSLMAIFVLNSRFAQFDMGIGGMALAILSSVLVGFLIGVVHVYLKIPSFMVSFAFMYICKGIAMVAYAGIPPVISDPLILQLPKIGFLNIPFITWVAFIVFAICVFIQEYTAFGRHVYAVGTDEAILVAVGVSAKRVKILVFVLAGFCFGVAGVLGAIRLGQGQVMIGDGLMFPAQAAVVIGGTSLAGGKGGVFNTIIGVFIMTVLTNGLILLGVNPYIKTGIEGLIVLIAVALTMTRGAKVISK